MTMSSIEGDHLRQSGIINRKQRFNKWFSNDVINVRYYTAYPLCNYACEYCVAGQHSKATLTKEFDPQKYLSIIDAITQLRFKINIRIGVGGEFFLDKDLIEGGRILSRARNVQHLNLITNLSQSYDTYLKLLNGYNHRKVAVVASYHPTQIRDKKQWLSTAVAMAKEYDFAAIVVAYPPLMKELAGQVSELRSAGIETFIQGFIGIHDGKSYPGSYSPDDRQLLKQLMYSRHDYEFFVNCKKPGLCNAGYKSLYIDKNGEVYSCGMGKGVKLGDLTQNSEVSFFNSPRPCIHETCLCDTENMNTLIFDQHYSLAGKNQHKYMYRFQELAKEIKELDEWEISY